MSTSGQKGVEAVKNKQYGDAVPLLDQAIADTESPTWLLARATAHQQLGNLDLALRDADLAYHVAADRGSGNSRQLMTDAQYRRSAILFRMGRYADADCCARWSQLLALGRPAREDDGVERDVDSQGFYTLTLEDALADGKENNPGRGYAGANGNTMRAQALAATMDGGGSGPGRRATGDWNRAHMWRCQVLRQMKGLDSADPGRKVTVTKIPSRPELEKPVARIKAAATAATTESCGCEERNAALQEADDSLADKGKTIHFGTFSFPDENSGSSDAETKAGKPAPAPGSVPDEKMKLRSGSYQTGDLVSVSLFVKDVNKDILDVEFHERSVTLGPIPREAAPYVRAGDREAFSTLMLGGEIKPEESKFSVTPRKIEITLRKKAPGVKWPGWGSEAIGLNESSSSPNTKSPARGSTDAANAATTASSAKPEEQAKTSAEPETKGKSPAPGPAYPTSSKKGPKDWDMLEDASDEEGEDKKDVDYFFKQLYKDATPEQQRAMMKSFVESNGTSLSTDWNDVKGRHVDTVPPEGVEEKKW